MSARAWQPDIFARRRPYLAARSKVIKAIRAYFEGEDFAEVDTPALQFSPGNEVHLQAFKTELKDPHGGPAQTLYLHTSPEFAMKKLLVAGEPRIFQIAHVYRNGERSSRHHPEFSMMEWYRANADTKPIMQDCVNLVRACARACGFGNKNKNSDKETPLLASPSRGEERPDSLPLEGRVGEGVGEAKTVFSANGMVCDPFAEWEAISVPAAFKRYADIDLLATAPDPHAPDAALLRKAMVPLGLRTTDEDTWDDLFFRVMGEKIEPFLGKDRPAFLCDYPISMAALARPKPEDPRLAERFELYIAGYEIANAFGELTDPDEQLRRFEADMDLKEKLHGERFPIDRDFINALRYGMPPSAGIALGVDRLVMLCAGTEKIEDVLWLPVYEGDRR